MRRIEEGMVFNTKKQKSKEIQSGFKNRASDMLEEQNRDYSGVNLKETLKKFFGG